MILKERTFPSFRSVYPEWLLDFILRSNFYVLTTEPSKSQCFLIYQSLAWNNIRGTPFLAIHSAAQVQTFYQVLILVKPPQLLTCILIMLTYHQVWYQKALPCSWPSELLYILKQFNLVEWLRDSSVLVTMTVCRTLTTICMEIGIQWCTFIGHPWNAIGQRASLYCQSLFLPHRTISQSYWNRLRSYPCPTAFLSL